MIERQDVRGLSYLQAIGSAKEIDDLIGLPYSIPLQTSAPSTCRCTLINHVHKFSTPVILKQ